MATPSILIVPDRYKSGVLYSQLPETGAVDFDVTRATPAFRTNASGVSESVASGVPRLDYPAAGGCPALLVEPAATNSIRNNSMQGAVTGTPGTLPTNWTEVLGGLSRQVVATGTENGVEYIDIKLSGTASATATTISLESSTQIVAAQNQVWTNSSYLKIVAAPLPPVSYSLGFREGLAVGTFVAFGSTAVTPTTTLTRLQATRTLTGVTTERVQPQLSMILVSGSTYDFTIRIGWPQMELGSVATSPIVTTSAAVTRNADVISKTGVSGFIGQGAGCIYVEWEHRAEARDRRILTMRSDNSNFIAITTFSSNQVSAGILVASASTIGAALASSALSVGIHKAALAYDLNTNGVAFYLDGALVGTTRTATALPSMSEIGLGVLGTTGANILGSGIRAAAIYTNRLSNTELAALTSL